MKEGVCGTTVVAARFGCESRIGLRGRRRQESCSCKEDLLTETPFFGPKGYLRERESALFGFLLT
jgi:hypothetical protein